MFIEKSSQSTLLNFAVIEGVLLRTLRGRGGTLDLRLKWLYGRLRR
jgi:hypothetical protein